MITDIILHWNAIALHVVAQDFSSRDLDVVGSAHDPNHTPDQGGPTRTSRALAIVHLAMADAWAGIQGQFKPYQSPLPALPASPRVRLAVSGAAWTTLRALYPQQATKIDQARTDTLALLPNGAAATNSFNWGVSVGDALLAARAADGATAVVAYVPSDAPGRHRADPFSSRQHTAADAGALHPHWGSVTPFAIGPVNAAPFLPDPPPALGSLEYLAAFDQVKTKGGATRGARTEDEEIIGLYWGYDGPDELGTPPRLYNQVLRTIAIARGNSVGENARLFGLANAAMADAGIQCWHAKYLYDLWRPVVGIREANPGTGPTGSGDGNPLTTGDAFWAPLGAPASNPDTAPVQNFTPPFPAYPSGHATFGAAAFGVVRAFYGTDAVSFSFVSDELDGLTRDASGPLRTRVSRTYTSLSQAIQENAISRVFLGVHWYFDGTAGVKAGEAVASATMSGILTTL